MTVGKKGLDQKRGDQSEEAESQRGRGRPQLRSDEETRAIIYETARHEFARNGYAATSMDNVARSAGMSTKTLYRLVPNKAVRRTEETLAGWLRAQAARGLIEIGDATSAAGMLLGMLVFQPMRAVMF